MANAMFSLCKHNDEDGLTEKLKMTGARDSCIFFKVGGKLFLMCFLGKTSVCKFFRCSVDEALLDKLFTEVSEEVLVQIIREMEGNSMASSNL